MTALEKIVFAVLVLVVAGGAYWWWKSQTPEPWPTAPVATPAPTQAPAEPEPGIQHPIEQAPIASGETAKPLPKLGESDRTAAYALATAMPRGKLPDFIITKLLVRPTVATVDNLPRDKVSMSLWPIKPTPGMFMVANTPDGKVIAPENGARYAPYVRYFE